MEKKREGRVERIDFYLDPDLREALELYIIDKDLDRTKKMTLSLFINNIIKEWCLSSKCELDEKYRFFAYRTKGRRLRRIAVFLTPDDKLEFHRIYIKTYLRSIKTVNMFIANIVEFWAIQNIKGYEKIFEEKFEEKFEISKFE